MRRYHHLDVFTDTPFTGNQLAVFLDGAGLSAELMQQIAQEMAFSETTFVLPAEAPDTGWRVRIFTPAVELPMAGHPTIGTAFAMADAGLIAPGTASVTLGLGVGPTPVRLTWAGDRLDFAWMRQAVPTFGRRPADLGALAAAIGVDERDLAGATMPVEEASAGVPFLYVPLATREAVDRAQPDRAAISRFFAGESMPELPLYVFTTDRGADRAAVYSRMFAPTLGVNEDPATGSASGPLGGYLFHHGAIPPAESRELVALQGAKMGRPSYIHIAISATALTMTDIQVGGRAVVVGEGEISCI